MVGHVLLLVASTLPLRTDLAVMTWNVCTGTNSDCRFYRAYQECDQRGARRTGGPTRESRKLDYLFALKGAVRGCHVERAVTLSDHHPVHIKVAR